jgi:lycopene beta-cyclase
VTYLQFHFLFLFPPILALIAMAPRIRGRLGRRGFLPLLALPPIALLYTTPWDNYLVWRGIWWYGPDRVVGTIGYVPVEEYLFFLLQPILTGLFTLHVLARVGDAGRPGAGAGPAAVEGDGGPAPIPGLRLDPPPRRPGFVKLAGALPWFVLAGVGAALLGTTSGLYMGLILAWACPVVGLMWLYMGPDLWRHVHVLGLAIGLPTLYLWIADAIAIRQGIWTISPEYTFGVNPFGLPIEEATFFLVTNVLSALGVLLFALPGFAGPAATTAAGAADPAASVPPTPQESPTP